MSTLSILIRAISILLAIAGGIFLMHLGYNWIHLGYGLNPWLAFPLAVGFIMFPCGMILWEAVSIADAVEEIREDAYLTRMKYYQNICKLQDVNSLITSSKISGVETKHF